MLGAAMDDERRALLDRMHLLTGAQFEQLCGLLFDALGYQVTVTPASADRGIDLELAKDGRVVLVQCKRQQSSVGEPAVRDFFGVVTHRGADKGVFCTNGSFSTRAETWAAGTRIELVDGAELATLLVQHGVQIPESWAASSPSSLTDTTPGVSSSRPRSVAHVSGKGRLTPADRVARAQEKWAVAGCEPLGIPRPLTYKPNGDLKKKAYVGEDGRGEYVVVHDGKIEFRGSWKAAMDYYDGHKLDW